MPPEEDHWQALWSGICDLSEMFPDGVVFIGGIAVYLHARKAGLEGWGIEFSHDGDFYISLADFADLRDIEEVTTNRRLSKHQIVKDGIDFDVYVERRHGLRVSFSDMAEASTVIEHVRVASPEHLLLLKLDAYADRLASAKGRKDERDLIRIAHVLARKVRENLFAPYVQAEDLRLMSKVSRSSEFFSMTRSPKQAASLRKEFLALAERIRSLLEDQ